MCWWAKRVTSEKSPNSAGVVRRDGSPDRFLRPMPLRLEDQALPGFLRGRFHLPTPGEPGDDLRRLRVEVGTKEGLGFEFASWITNQHPTQGHGGQLRAVPDRRARDDLY